MDSERFLLTLMRYIDLIPVRAGMAAHRRDYLWASHAFNAQGASGPNSDGLTPHKEICAWERGRPAKPLPEIVPGGGFKRRFKGNPGMHAQGMGAGKRAVQGTDRTFDPTPHGIEGWGRPSQ